MRTKILFEVVYNHDIHDERNWMTKDWSYFPDHIEGRVICSADYCACLDYSDKIKQGLDDKYTYKAIEKNNENEDNDDDTTPDKIYCVIKKQQYYDDDSGKFWDYVVHISYSLIDANDYALKQNQILEKENSKYKYHPSDYDYFYYQYTVKEFCLEDDYDYYDGSDSDNDEDDHIFYYKESANKIEI